MKITVDITVTEQIGSFETRSVAHSKVEIEAPWEEIRPAAVHNSLEEAVADANGRMQDQLRRIARTKLDEARRIDAEQIGSAV